MLGKKVIDLWSKCAMIGIDAMIGRHGRAAFRRDHKSIDGPCMTLSLEP
jgi:hypothetical protein